MPYLCSLLPPHWPHVRSGNDSAVDAKIVELRPYFREDFMTYLQSEYNRITTPPMTEQVSQNQRGPLPIWNIVCEHSWPTCRAS